MKTIRFEFTCSRPVPLYAHLCNQYLNHHGVNIGIGYQSGCYFIEAQGEQSQIEPLADDIAQTFPVSVWLTDSRTILAEEPQGKQDRLDNGEDSRKFCHQCLPLFGDIRSQSFGDVSIQCSCCHGEKHLEETHRGLTPSDITGLVDELTQTTTLTLTGGPTIRLSLSSMATGKRDRILICNPAKLNANFLLENRQVLALSSFEKPFITARPVSDHPDLDATLFDLCLAYSRLLVILAEHLSQRGYDWVYIDDPQKAPPLALMDDGWVEIRKQTPHKVLLNRLRQPLHSDAIFPGSGDFYYRAKANGKQYSCELVRGGAEQPMRFRDQDYAMCAFHSVNLEHQQEKHCAIIYLSQEHGGQIYTIDANKQSELFFSLPVIPERGVDIYNELAESSQKKVTEKFKETFPEECRRLLELELPAPTNNLHSLWAVAAVMLGLKSRSMYVDDLRDALLSAALAHRGHNSPRIDFPLTKGEEDNSFNWRKTLGTMISFRLADDRDKSKLAFGMQDSLADYLSGWIDNLDHNIGIESVILAGSEWTNQVLTRRVTLRIGKNFQLKHNQLLEIDGNNLAIGALLLKKRRF